MKKRLISLALILAMVTSMLTFLTGCSSTGNTAEESVRTPMTITIAMIKEEGTTEEGIQATQDALNKITEKTLNTHVVLQLYSEDEYDAAVQAKMKARLEYMASLDKIDNDYSSNGGADDKVLNEYGREVTAYPEPYENQIDIFLVNGISNLEYYQMFPSAGVTDEEYALAPANNSQNVLASLGDYLTDGTANLLTKYISTTLMDSCRFEEELYAIPSNYLYGEAEYMLIDKKVFDQYSYNIEDVTALESLELYLSDVAKEQADITPLYNYGNMNLVSVTGRPSAICAYIPDGSDPAAAGWQPKQITSIAAVRTRFDMINKFASVANKYPVVGNEIPEDKLGTFAVGFVAADATSLSAYEDDYYIVKTQSSTPTTEQVYNNAFSVFLYPKDEANHTARCMEVIKLIQTDREFHNTLLYGVENVTYTVDEDTGIITRKKEGTDGKVYLMDESRCGNLFITTPNDEMSENMLAAAENDWKKAKDASRNISFSPYMGFALEYAPDDFVDDPAKKTYQVTEKDAEALEKLYYETIEKLADYPNHVDEYDSFNAYYSAVHNEMMLAEGGVIMNQGMTTNISKSIAKQYLNWWSEKYPAAE